MDNEPRAPGSAQPPRAARDAAVAPAWQSIADLPVALAVFDRDVRYVAASCRWLHDYGLAGRDVVGESHYDLFPDLPERWKAIHQRALAGETVVAQNDCFERADGSRQWLNWETRPWYDAGGAVGGLQMWAEDVSGRMVAESAVRDRAQEFQALAEGMPQMVWMTNPEGVNLYFSPQWTSYTGQSAATGAGEGWSAVIHPDDLPRMWAAWRHATTSGDDFTLEVRLRRADGVYRWFLVRALPRCDATGQIVKWIGSCTDIDDLKRAAAALVLQTAALEAAANGIVITNREGIIEWTNAAFSHLTGFTPEESVGRTPGELLKSGHHDPAFYEHMWKTILEGGVWRGEIINKRKAGGLYTDDMTITPLKDAAGVVTHFVAWKEDITQQNVLADQLRQAQRLESVGRLAGGVAHDFNNMLSVILGYAELAVQQGDPPPLLRGYLSGIHTAGLRSADLTQQLLAFARKQIINPKVLDLNEAVARELKMLRRLIGEDITLTWRPTAEPLPIMMDPSQMDQILANLSINARDAIVGVGSLDFSTNRRVVDGQFCETHAEAVPGDYVQLTVADSGRGMTKEVLSRIFEPFFTTKGVGEGTGLGLATIYGAVTQNHGFMAVSSVPGQGTTFEIYFPRCDSPVLPEPTRDVLAPLPRGHETILLVEDELAVLHMTATTLEAQGYTVLLAHGATEAIRVAETHAGAIDLLLTDVVMPEMNGHDLAKTLASTRPALKRLFMSGHTANIMQGQDTTLEQATFIAKPLTLLALTEKVRAVLDSG